jgi:hypothetical protein
MAIFSGTTPPTYESCEATNMANIYPTFSPGRLLTQNSKALIEWSKGKTGVHIYGQSLGGGTALAHGAMLENVKSVNVVNPIRPQMHVDIPKEAAVNVYINAQDWVSALGGVVPDHTNVHLLTPKKLKTSLASRFVLTHIQPFNGSEHTKLETISGKEYNKNHSPYYKRIGLFIGRSLVALVGLPVLLLVVGIRKILGRKSIKHLSSTDMPESIPSEGILVAKTIVRSNQHHKSHTVGFEHKL